MSDVARFIDWFTAPWTRHEDEIDELRETMAEYGEKTAAAIADINDATNTVAARLDALAAKLSSIDSDTADALTAEASRLRGLAADPDNVVPAPVPAPDDPNEPAA